MAISARMKNVSQRRIQRIWSTADEMVWLIVSCLSCLKAGTQSDITAFLECACYYGESAKNMHCRSKEHVSKFNSKSDKIRAESAFYKHLVNTHEGKSANKNFSDYFEGLQKTVYKAGRRRNIHLKSQRRAVEFEERMAPSKIGQDNHEGYSRWSRAPTRRRRRRR